MRLLDQFLPRYDFNEVHAVTIHSAEDRVFKAIKGVTLGELPVFRALFWLRAIPARLVGRPLPQFVARETLWAWARRSGFVVLAEVPRQELVLGVIGQPWKLAAGAVPNLSDAHEFVTFFAPGYVKAGVNFWLEGSGTSERLRLATETRVRATDPAARAKFARYWRLIRPGSALIRREWLAAIKRRAESGAVVG